MAKVSREAAEVNARIVYWGAEGAGKSANLRAAYTKMRPDHRGELREVPSRLDPAASYEVLPISLGEVAGIRTQIELIAAPGQSEQAATRKLLLDQVDGIVLVIDATADRVDANMESYEELCRSLAAYGRNLSDVPFVLQYNKRDLADPYALEDLHRKLDSGNVAVFESVASEGTGVLQTLSTISKQVIRSLRDQAVSVPHKDTVANPPTTEASSAERMEVAILDEASSPDGAALDSAAQSAQTLLDEQSPWPQAGEIEAGAGVRIGPGLSIVSVGRATRSGDRSVRIPLVLGDPEGGTSTLVLTIQLDAIPDGESG